MSWCNSLISLGILNDPKFNTYFLAYISLLFGCFQGLNSFMVKYIFRMIFHKLTLLFDFIVMTQKYVALY
jgi:hypothetical protein